MYGGPPFVFRSHICQYLVKNCSRMGGEYPFFRDTLIVRSAV